MRLHEGTWLAVLAALLAGGCGQKADAPWLTMPDLASHAVHFPIGPANVHGASPGLSPNCDGCHFDKATGLPSSTFRTFTCTNCHVSIRVGVDHFDATAVAGATFHAGVANYASTVASFTTKVASLNGGVGPQGAADGACLSCHPTGMATDHATLFPLPHQNAAGTQVAVCSNCHRDLSDRRKLGCAVCHPHDQAANVSGHASVPGFVSAAAGDAAAAIEAASALCVRCHGDGVVPVRVAGHAAAAGGFIVGTGVHAGVNGGGCLDCHPAYRTTPPKTFAADFSKYACGVACHGTVPVTAAGSHADPVALGTFHAAASVDFTGKVAALGYDAACLSCHGDGTGGLPANHPFPVGSAPSHPIQTCSSCHTPSTARNNPANFACGTCHLTLDPALATKHSSPTIPVTDYATTSDRCLYCHGDAQVNRAANHPSGDGTPLANNVEHRTAGCSVCHKLPRIDKPFAADWGRRDCRPCHGANGPI
jgi:hypothetical protein